VAHSNTYYMLIGSLPALPAEFDAADQVPISKLRLEERLRMLEPEDAEVLDHLRDFLVWERQPLERTSDEIRRHYERFMEEIEHDFSRKLMETAMSARTLVAAMRRRRMGQESPDYLGPWQHVVIKNWQRPDFGLGAVFPWLNEVHARLHQDPPAGLNRTLLNIGWTWAKRQAGEYDFASFEAIILYVFRWEMLYRWTTRDADAGLERFEKLVGNAMAEYEDMF
jgi:hypothetical protein